MFYNKNNEIIQDLDIIYKDLKIDDFVPRIKMMGVGGAGCNILERMVKEKPELFKDIVKVMVNTNKKDLHNQKNADIKLQIGENLTKGNGAGTEWMIGRKGAEENKEEIIKLLENTDLLYIIAGMGKGTGTGAAPYIAQVAKEKDILTISAITTPFDAEGVIRYKTAMTGLDELKKHSDVVYSLSNQKVYVLNKGKNKTMMELLKEVDKLLINTVTAISDVILQKGYFDLDFADLAKITKDKGTAHMGVGTASGEGAIFEATQKALNGELLDSGVRGAKGLIFNIKGPEEKITATEFYEVMDILQKEIIDENCNILPSFRNCIIDGADIEVTLIATGYDDDFESLDTKKFKEENLQNQQNNFVKEEVKVQIQTQENLEDDDDSIPSYLKGFKN